MTVWTGSDASLRAKVFVLACTWSQTSIWGSECDGKFQSRVLIAMQELLIKSFRSLEEALKLLVVLMKRTSTQFYVEKVRQQRKQKNHLTISF